MLGWAWQIVHDHVHDHQYSQALLPDLSRHNKNKIASRRLECCRRDPSWAVLPSDFIFGSVSSIPAGCASFGSLYGVRATCFAFDYSPQLQI